MQIFEIPLIGSFFFQLQNLKVTLSLKEKVKYEDTVFSFDLKYSAAILQLCLMSSN